MKEEETELTEEELPTEEELQKIADSVVEEQALRIANGLELHPHWFYRASKILGISENQVRKRLLNHDKPRKRRPRKPKPKRTKK